MTYGTSPNIDTLRVLPLTDQRQRGTMLLPSRVLTARITESAGQRSWPVDITATFSIKEKEGRSMSRLSLLISSVVGWLTREGCSCRWKSYRSLIWCLAAAAANSLWNLCSSKIRPKHSREELGNEIRQGSKYSKIRQVSGSLPKQFPGDPGPLATNIPQEQRHGPACSWFCQVSSSR